MNDFYFGFRVLGDCRQPRRLVDAGKAFAAYVACNRRCELDRESYLSAFQFAGDFAEHLKRNSSPKGFVGACWAPWLWFDVDAEGEPRQALDAARRLATAATETLGIRENDVLAFFSGAKGFHLGLPTATWAPEPGNQFHCVARRFAEALAERAGVGIDSGVYDRVRCFRAPNSRHPRTGLHKRRLTVDGLLHLSPERIVQLAAMPEPFEILQPSYRSEAAAQLWREAAEHVQSEAEAKATRLAEGNGTAKLNRATLAFIREGANDGDRHRLLYSAAANLAELGAPLPLCAALLSESALDVGLTPLDVRRGIENGWASVQPRVRDVLAAVQGEVVGVELPSAESDGAV
ncbi:MAG: DNA primase [Planctomycetes bacterium]|nr:DNA primase [Planctomycetota bacterium]